MATQYTQLLNSLVPGDIIDIASNRPNGPTLHNKVFKRFQNGKVYIECDPGCNWHNDEMGFNISKVRIQLSTPKVQA